MKRFILITLFFLNNAIAMKENGQPGVDLSGNQPPQINSGTDSKANGSEKEELEPLVVDDEPEKKPNSDPNDGKKPKKSDLTSFIKTVGRFAGAGPLYFLDFGMNAWQSGNYAQAVGTFGVAYKTIHLMPYVGSHVRDFCNEIPDHLQESIGERPAYHVIKAANGLLDGSMMYTFAPELERKYRDWQDTKINGKKFLDGGYNTVYERGSFVWAVAAGLLANYAAESQLVKKLEHRAAEKLKAFWAGDWDKEKVQKTQQKTDLDSDKKEIAVYANGVLVSADNQPAHNQNAMAMASNADFLFTINGHQPTTCMQYVKDEGSKLVIHYALYKVGTAILNSALLWHQERSNPKL